MKKLWRKLFPHKHKWIDTTYTVRGAAIEQRCKCGVYRHHFWRDVQGDHINWREGRHPLNLL